MNKQKLMPITLAMDDMFKIFNERLSEDYKAFIDKDNEICDIIIEGSENTVFSLFDHIIESDNSKDLLKYLNNMPCDTCFSVSLISSIALNYYAVHEQLMPIFPIDTYYLNLLCYIKEGYLRQKKYCNENSLSMWDQFIDFQLS